jgi:hypothetical protein
MAKPQRSLKADVFRRKAASCVSFLAGARSGADRAQLVRMRDTWLALAAQEDRLDGLPPTPPALALVHTAHH